MAKVPPPSVSVIIPMYNAEKYIEECLNSLLKQTLKNFEVIVVDDCSTDNSLDVTKRIFPKFAKKRLKISIVKTTKNIGCPGIPRNVGIDFAEGEYIYFLDSDDFLDETALEDFYKVAEKFNADVVHTQRSFDYKEIDGTYQNILVNLETRTIVEKPELETFDIAERMTNFVENRYNTLTCSKFIRRKFLVENDIKFPAITISEDFILSLMCLSSAKNYVIIPFIGHHYRRRGDSVTKSTVSDITALSNLIEGIYFLDSFMQKKKFFVENPKYRYLIIEVFDRWFSDLIFTHFFFTMDWDPGVIYNRLLKEILSMNPQKNTPLTAYLFVSMNIYKMLANQQAEEIKQLKKILQSK